MNTATATENTAVATPQADPNAILKALFSEYDIHFGLDASGSMVNMHNKTQTRWAAAHELVLGLAGAALKLDDDGINLTVFQGSSAKTQAIKDLATVNAIFSNDPTGGTPMLEALQELFKVAGKSPKKDMIIIATDGEPSSSSKEAVAEAIVAFSKTLNSDEDCTILFIQLGDDAASTKFLKYLDDNLVGMGAKFDIVDVKTAEEVAQFPSFAHLLQAAQQG